MDASTKGRFTKRKALAPAGPLDLVQKVAVSTGTTGYSLEFESTIDRSSGFLGNEAEVASGLYGGRRRLSTTDKSDRRRLRTFKTVDSKGANRKFCYTSTKGSTAASSRCTKSQDPSQAAVGVAKTTTHIVCSVSENLARETCVASLDAGAPLSLQVSKQGNGQTYAETIAYLEILQPDEVLLNEGRRNSQLARKIMELYQVQEDFRHVLPKATGGLYDAVSSKNVGSRARSGGLQAYQVQDRYGSLQGTTTIKFVSRAYFDQTKGAALLQRVAREDLYDPTLVEEYILLSATHAVLHYAQHALGVAFAKKSLQLLINAGGSNRMAIDRSTLLQLELLVNSKTGKVRNSLIGTIDCTKTTVGSRLLRTNLMSPPTRVDTINARLELVDSFLSGEDFFYSVHEHLSRLPDVDKMLSNVALIPNAQSQQRQSALANRSGIDTTTQRLARKGISALISIKSTLSALPSLAGDLKRYLHELDAESSQIAEQDAGTARTDRSSLLIGLGGNGAALPLQRNHLLRAIIFAFDQTVLSDLLHAVTDAFNDSTTYTRKAHERCYEECFALRCDEDSIIQLLRRTFLMNVDDIYKKADEYAEVHGFNVSVRYSATRGYYLAVPIEAGYEMPKVFIMNSKAGRFINCTTEDVNSLNIRARDNVNDLLLLTHQQIQGLLDCARQHYDAIAAVCDAISILDMCHSFADHVTVNPLPWCRPLVYESSVPVQDVTQESSNVGKRLLIRNGRYAIDVTNYDHSAENRPATFIPNDVYATSKVPFTVISGINGSGKSTYLKQIAMIVILAQCGSYVPAEQAMIPLFDRLCTRIGNADDQEHNLSTFMLEMKETAFICNHATDKSLILMDELGRATSNEDGVAIAWSVSEHLLQTKAFTFFVTHYPQMSRLGDVYPSVQNMHLEAFVTGVGQQEDESYDAIKYSHKVKNGACQMEQDYGVELAATCGWPADTVHMARRLERDIRGKLPGESICQPDVDAVEVLHAVDELNQALKKIVTKRYDDTMNVREMHRALMELQNEFLTQKTPPEVARIRDFLLRNIIRSKRSNRDITQNDHDLHDKALPLESPAGDRHLADIAGPRTSDSSCLSAGGERIRLQVISHQYHGESDEDDECSVAGTSSIGSTTTFSSSSESSLHSSPLEFSSTVHITNDARSTNSVQDEAKFSTKETLQAKDA